MNDNAPVTPLNDARKHGERRRQASIPIGEDVNLRALGPSLVEGGMDSLLHILTIEVNRGLRGTAGVDPISNRRYDKGERSLRETQDIPQNRILGGRISRSRRNGQDENVPTTSKIL